jgi:hypothetical protein
MLDGPPIVRRFIYRRIVLSHAIYFEHPDSTPAAVSVLYSILEAGSEIGKSGVCVYIAPVQYVAA